ncbi:ead/Ea22-like family protein [Escherichia coli]|nr:ead/Ea22-like family protein [Escherichia coli]EHN4444563.1 ead/Ea22-like family protein [Escherichia coli]EIG1877725.1 ead/Ea22-like family protein [Escherichia coli]EJG3454887.1 ead/Ea22-like family protein [Escherichia coli]EJU2437939.1 ead/Ea22-like family protein [Escherichia coli]
MTTFTREQLVTLREAAEAAKGDTTWQNLQAFRAAAMPEVVQALLDENESMCRDLIARNGEIEGLRKLVADLEAKQSSLVVPEGLIKAVRFYEQVKRENPPVETGAWKDAVDWVLKEACQAVNIGIKGE